MKAYDFSYDNRNLSEFGMMICSFNGSSGVDTKMDGAQVTFNTIPSMRGLKHNLISAQYEECLETTFQICKYSCNNGIQEITAIEHRELTKWLCRKDFLKFKILDEDNIDLFHEAIISVSKIELDGKIIGLELEVRTNRPFALKEAKMVVIKNTVQNGKHSVNDTSYEEGYIYPYTEIIVAEDGDLDIYNVLEDRHTFIKNCIANEVITMDYPIIRSSISSHKIQNDFNYNFFRVVNTYKNSRNDLIISIPCTIKIKYNPIVKVGL